MKSIFLLLFAVITVLNGYAQCSPDQQFIGQPLGFYDDTATTCTGTASFTFVSETEFTVPSFGTGNAVAFKITGVSSPAITVPTINIEDWVTTNVMNTASGNAPFGTWYNTGTTPNQAPIIGCMQIDVPAQVLQFIGSATINVQIELDIQLYYPALGTLWLSAFGSPLVYDVWVTFLPDQGAPTISFDVSAPSCTGISDGAIEAIVTGGTPPYTYSWNPTSSAGNEIDFIPSGQYSLTITDGCNTSITEDVTVPVGGPEVSLEAFSEVCTRTEEFVLDGGAPAGGFYTVNGTPATTFDPATMGEGTYTLVYTYTDGNNCTVSASQQIVVTEAPVINILGNTDPDGQSSSEYAVAENPELTFSWSVDGDGQIISGAGTNSVEIFWGSSASGLVSVTVTSQTGCTFTESLVVGDNVGIEDNLESSFTLQPNPSTGIFHIQITDMSGVVNYRVLDATGRLITENVFQGSATVDLSNQPTGVYSVLVTTERGTAVKRLVKQ